MINEQVLFGSLLGDGCLTFSNRNINPLYAEYHSIKQLEYLKWKNQFFNSKIKERKTHLKKTGKTYQEYYFRTGAKAFLLPYYHLFYKGGKKSVNTEILSKLEPLAIAVWYCDDGSYSYYNNNCKLCVGGFQHEERKLISDHFMLNFGINFKFEDEYIYLNADDTKVFISIIREHVPECMHYKLGLDIEKKRIYQTKNTLRCKNYWHRNKKNPKWIKKERKRLREYMRWKRANSKIFLPAKQKEKSR